jgi:NifU-like protein involved in Fe-S cluster formation
MKNYIYKKKIDGECFRHGPFKTSCGEFVTLIIKKNNNSIVDVAFETEGSQLIHEVMEHLCLLIINKSITNKKNLEDFFNTFSIKVEGLKKETIISLLQDIFDAI